MNDSDIDAILRRVEDLKRSDAAPARFVPRIFVGGPFDGDMRACSVLSVGMTIPLPERWRAKRDVPEWVQYVLDGEDMRFLARATSIDKCLEASMRHRAYARQSG